MDQVQHKLKAILDFDNLFLFRSEYYRDEVVGTMSTGHCQGYSAEIYGALLPNRPRSIVGMT